MKAKSICNRDLKLDNILIAADFSVKIADFGFAERMIEGKLFNQIFGTPGYMAPEILQGEPYSGSAVDMFALGVLLFAIVTKTYPFGSKDSLPEGVALVQVDS